jgi:hypothetical protein
VAYAIAEKRPLCKGTANALSIVADLDGLDVYLARGGGRVRRSQWTHPRTRAKKSIYARGTAEAGGLELRARCWLAPLQKHGDVRHDILYARETINTSRTGSRAI